ncbi:MAG: thiamine biosynthesis protein [Thaumarchaeota archaeon]|nr:MAG: thiamine biosynthesis protein [Nitrososphaerota archaeon]
MSQGNENRMNHNTVLVVFPSVFSLNKINYLVKSISNILKIKKQVFTKIRRDGSIIIVEAKDPVLASSAISLLFGIDRVAIAKEVDSNFDTVLSTITSTGLSLLLKGDKFYVKVEGKTKSYLAKDLEVAATANLIEKTTGLQTRVGSEKDNDRFMYTWLTNSHAYVCIFVDKGMGGVPYGSQGETILCCIYDELSAISCLQSIKMGFDVMILVCYRSESDLLRLSKMIDKILSRIVRGSIELQFCKIFGISDLLTKITVVTHIMLSIASKSKISRIALAISPIVFPLRFVEYNAKIVFQNNLVPWFPLSGIDSSILENAREIGLEKYILDLENLCRSRFRGKTIPKATIQRYASDALKNLRRVSITIGSKNVHNIIDSLKSKH